jgi:hypothetical protein
MLHRDEDFQEWQLAEAAKEYIPLYLRNPEDRVCYVEYRDVPTNSIKHVKFVYLNDQWVYADNSQFS